LLHACCRNPVALRHSVSWLVLRCRSLPSLTLLVCRSGRETTTVLQNARADSQHRGPVMDRSRLLIHHVETLSNRWMPFFWSKNGIEPGVEPRSEQSRLSTHSYSSWF